MVRSLVGDWDRKSLSSMSRRLEGQMLNIVPHQVSRRGLLTASLAAPLAGSSSELVSAVFCSAPRDPAVAKAATWIAERQRLDAMTHQWQRLETQLFRRASELGVQVEAAHGRRFPEIRAMRVLDERMEAVWVKLAILAKEACVIRSVSPEGALVKIELGLCVQGRYNWEDHALELIRGGIRDFREHATRRSELHSKT